MTSTRLLAIPIFAIFILGCQDDEETNIDESESLLRMESQDVKPDLAWEGVVIEPPPRSIDVAFDVAPKEEIYSPFRTRLTFASRVHIVVFSGTVEALEGAERHLPTYVRPESDSPIVTDVQIGEVQAICGSVPRDLVLTFIGGQVGRRRLATSLQPNLKIGQSYIFAATELGGSYYLVGGKNDLLVHTDFGLADSNNNSFITTDLKGICP